MKAYVNKIIHSSVVDGPGNRASIFLQGCNYRCTYCHNPETINLCRNCFKCLSACPTKALYIKNEKILWNREICIECDSCIKVCPFLSSPKIRFMSAEEVFNELKEDIPFIRGITVSGGECSLQRDFLIELFTLAKQHQLHILMDSNGSYSYMKDQELMSICDGVMLDIKAWDDQQHQKITGRPSVQVINNLHELAFASKLSEVRTVIVDTFNNLLTVDEISKALASHNSNKILFKIIKYRSFGVREPYRSIYNPPSPEEIQLLYQKAYDNGLRNLIII